MSTATHLRMKALDRANAVRSARFALKQRIAAREVSAAEVILTCPPEANTWPIAHLLKAQTGWGVVRARRFLRDTAISENRPVGNLTDRQKRLLAAELQRSGRLGAAGTA